MIALVRILSVAILGFCLKAVNAQQPNIIMIMTDDLGWGDVGFNGNKVIRTPNLDRLAAGGVTFDRFYAAAPVCSPTRASVLTGRNPFRMGITHANTGHLPEEEVTLPELLQEAGYRTGFFGKWHLGTLTTKQRDSNRGGRSEHEQHFSIPTMHGYDEFFCTEAKIPTHDPMVIPASFLEGESRRYGWKAREKGEVVEAYSTAYWDGQEQPVFENLAGANARVITDRVIPFIEHSYELGNPFFATVWFHTPHLPVVTDSFHRSLYVGHSLQEQLYYGSITAMDDQIGRLWQRLEGLGLAANTMLWFCSDNGPEQDTPGSPGVYRERKRSLYEGGVRVPAFVVWKDLLNGGKRIDTPLGTVDYLPTLVDILKLTYNHPGNLDGISIWSHVKGDKRKRKAPMGFLFQEKMSWVDDRFKLISINGGFTWEIYDLKKDPTEKENLITKQSRRADQMRSAFKKWERAVYEDVSRS